MTQTVDSIVVGLDDPALTEFFAGKQAGDNVEMTLSVGDVELKATGQIESVDDTMVIMNLQKYEIEGEEVGPEIETEEEPSEDQTAWLEKKTTGNG